MKTAIYSFFKPLLAALFFFVSTAGWGQINITTTGSYSQDFNTLISSGSATWNNNATIPNWYAKRTGTGSTIAADSGAASGGNLYSYGESSNLERALGSLGSGNAAAGSFAYGVLLRNNSSVSVTDIKVTYVLEQWRNSAVATAHDIKFFYKVSSSAISDLQPNVNTSWTPVTSLDTSGPITGGVAGPLNGNLPANRVTKTNVTIPGLNLGVGEYIMLKWDDADHSGSDHGLSIDDVTVAWTVAPTATISFANLQFPGSHTMNEGSTFDVYGQVYAAGLTEAAGAGTGITAQVGYSTNNTNPDTWTNWINGAFNTQVGNNDEFKTTWGNNLTPGTYYYATRFRIGNGAWVYGGYNTNVPTAGGIWNGTANVSGVLTVNSNKVTWGNFQHPFTGTVVLGSNYDVYGQVHDPEITPPPGQGAGISAEVGFSLSNTNPNSPTGWTWNSASYNTDSGNNDEYRYNIGSKFTSGGTHYMAFRYRKSGSTEYVYGGTGGIWNSDNATVDVTVPVNITSTLTKSTIYGAADSYTITATGSTPFTYAATGLPAGLTIIATTGVISGTVTGNVGTYNVTISATNGGGTDTETLVWTVNPRAITITGLAGVNKIYDATTSATLSGTPVLNTIVPGDDVSITGTPTASFGSKTVGTAKPITVTGFTLAGTKAGNYTVTQPTGLTANITTKALTVTGAVAQNKDYDGSTAATITGATLVGVISSDEVTVSGGGTFAQPNVGTGISVTANLSLGGTDAGNYTLTQPAGLSANITAVSPTISATVITINVGGTYALPGANISSNSTGAFSYILGTPVPAGSITLTGSNTLNGIAVGSATLTVNQTANGNYTAGTGTVTVNVISCTPPVWEENFDYGSCDIVDISTNSEFMSSWAFQSNGTDPLKYNTTGLTYLGYASSGIGGSGQYEGGADDDFRREISGSTGISSGALYASFMLNVVGAGAADYFLSFMDNNSNPSFYGLVQMRSSGLGYQLGIRKSTTGTIVWNTPVLSFNSTYLIVVKNEFVSGSVNDVFKMWIIPNGVPGTEALAGTPTLTAVTADTDPNTSIRYFAIRQTGKENAFVDGIRVATSWESLFCGTAPIAKTYTWTGASSSAWSNATNWSPNGVPSNIDNIVINSLGANKLNITDCRTVKDFKLNETGEFNVSANGTLTINGNIIYGGTASATLNCASTVNITSPSSQPVPPLSYGNLDVRGGDRVFSPTGEIGICGAFNVEPNNYSYTVTNSTVNYKSPDPNWVMMPFTYHHLKFTGTGDFSIGYSDPQVDKTINVQGDFTQTAGTLYLGETTSNTATLNVDGNMTVTGGVLQMNYVSGGKGIVNLKGNFSGSASAVMEAANTGAAFNFTGSGSQANPQQISYANQGSASKIIFTVNSGTYAKLVNQDFALGTNSKFNVLSGGTLDFGFNGSQALNIVRVASQTGQTFALEDGGTLKISSPDGISTFGNYTGNVQVGATTAENRKFGDNATYHYVGKTTQVSGNGLPGTASGKKVIIELETTNSPADDNLDFTVNGLKYFTSAGQLEIRKGKVIDAAGNGFADASSEDGSLLMSGGRYKISRGGTQPSLGGDYILTGGVIEFSGTPAINIRTGNPAKQYFNVDVSGSNVTPGGKNLVVNNELKVTSATAVLTIPEVPDSENPYVVTAHKGIQVAEGGQAIFKNNANLMQDEDAVNTGSVQVERTTKMKKMDYVYWSSPVQGQKLLNTINPNSESSTGGFSPGTPNTRIFRYNEPNDYFYATTDTDFVAGKGYAIRGKSGYGTTPTADIFNFTGTPHNGDEITVEVQRSPNNAFQHGYNLIGNPYLSALDFQKFFDGNSSSIKGTAWFWSNAFETLYQTGSVNYLVNNYAVLTLAGGSPPTTTPGNYAIYTPTEKIKAGQGFIVQVRDELATTSVVEKDLIFKNTMRITGGGVFFNNPARQQEEKNRYWLRFVSPDGIANTILLAHMAGATDGYDQDYDAELFTVADDSFYSVTDSRKMQVQAKGEFVQDSKIDIGTKQSKDGNYTIELVQPEGIFGSGQGVYLHDKLNGTYTNLFEHDYTFAASKGFTDNRFEIVYKPGNVLGTGNHATKDDLLIYRDGDLFVIKSSSATIDEIEIFDASGRLLVNLHPQSTVAKINGSVLRNGVYFLKIDRKGSVTNKKIIK